MRILLIFISSCVLAAVVPFLPVKRAICEKTDAFPDWPDQFEGVALTRLPLSENEKKFERGFPGRFARFTDGRREIVMRWISEPTRKLHPASDCYRASGYAVIPEPVGKDRNNVRWGRFKAKKDNEYNVRERIHDLHGNNWTDVSSWYWVALLGKTGGPWRAITVAEKQSLPRAGGVP